jgi:predicted dehydrogenase/nucleoside-diphosphate-sugar epimerase
VGAGYISRIHADVLQTIPDVRIAAIVDPNRAAAERLAASCGNPRLHATIADAVADADVQAAHVLVPPGLHATAALPFLQAGKPVLLEKPMATSSAECATLLDASTKGGALLAINQNFLFNPMFVELRRRLKAGMYGRPNHVDVIYNMPLRQLAARQFTHWMFQQPVNILLEQAVHPLSQIAALAGRIQGVQAIAGKPVQLAPGRPFHPELSMTLACENLPAQLRFAVGQAFPFWQITVVCDDGVVVADILANRVHAYTRTLWLDAVDKVVSGAKSGGSIAFAGLRNAFAFARSTLRLGGPSDPFFLSMQGSIGAFHRAQAGGPRPEADGAFGAALVTTCEQVAAQCFAAPAAAVAAPAMPAIATAGAPDVAVLGGTGFIGAETCRQLLAKGMRVAVMARTVHALPPPFDDPRLTLHKGDIADAGAVTASIGKAGLVVNLAHGGGGGSFEQIRAAMVGGAETVARACLAAGVRRLVHVGSIASLYLGPQQGAITGSTPPDPEAETRADYARAKALCDRMLRDMYREQRLPVAILRPGLVVGAGSPPLHSGLGFFNNDQHCIGWNRGTNPLPFVLVEDVAAAIVLALHAEAIDGQCFNLVGDVRPSAREYISQLGAAQGRPLRFHPQFPTQLWLEEMAKWLVKRAGGRTVPLPSRRDIVSRGLMARFDCSDAKRALGWQPVADPAVFAAQAIAVHAP